MEQKIPSAIAQLDSAVDEALVGQNKAIEEYRAIETVDLSQAGETLPADETAPPVQTLDQALASSEEKTPADSFEEEPHADSVTPPPSEGLEELEKYRKRYDVLKGKFDSEVPELHNRIRDLEYQLADLQEQPSEQEAGPDALQPDAPAYMRYLSSEESGDFGEDILEVQSRMVRGVVEEILAPKIRLIEDLIDEVRFTAQRPAQESSSSTFWSEVEAEFPGAKDINDNDVVFHAFLDEQDPNSGVLNRQVGQAALQNRDVGRLVDLMQRYASEYGVSDTPSGKGKTGPKVKPKRSRGSSAGETTASAVSLIKESDIKQFYKDLADNPRTRKFSEDELRAREKVIDKAMREGRIVRGR